MKKDIVELNSKDENSDGFNPNLPPPLKKKPSDLYEILRNQEKYMYNFRSFYPKFSIKYLGEWIKEKRRKKSMFLIMMQLRTGKYDMFTTGTTNKYFEHLKGMYYIDPDMMRMDIHTKMPLLYYHQDIAMPFRIEFDIDTIHKQMQLSEDKTIDKALNPTSLKGFINSEVIEKVLKGQELSEEMRLIKILIIVSLIINVIGIIITMKGLGWI